MGRNMGRIKYGTYLRVWARGAADYKCTHLKKKRLSWPLEQVGRNVYLSLTYLDLCLLKIANKCGLIKL